MFLYDAARTGRTHHVLQSSPLKIGWKFRLRSQGTFGAETQPIQDDNGSYYFGAHDGCVYCLSEDGDLRWMFRTDRKIYPTPLLSRGLLFVLCGNGSMVALDTGKGTLVWETRIADRPRPLGIISDLAFLVSYRTYDYEATQRRQLRSWGSPNISGDEKTIYVCARGTGLTALDAATGSILWRYDLGAPRHHLSGPARDKVGTLYTASQRGLLHAISPGGQRRWMAKAESRMNTWGGPSLDEARGRLYLAGSWRNQRGILRGYDLSGSLLWKHNFPGALRGAASIATDGTLYLACGNGTVYKLDGASGRELASRRLTIAPMLSLWTTPVISGDAILVSAVLNIKDGALIVLNPDLTIKQQFECGKALSPPLVDRKGRVLFGSWDGYFYCLTSDN